jgi:hypothetical protein
MIFAFTKEWQTSMPAADDATYYAILARILVNITVLAHILSCLISIIFHFRAKPYEVLEIIIPESDRNGNRFLVSLMTVGYKQCKVLILGG